MVPARLVSPSLALALALAGGALSAQAAADDPFVATYCVDCHGGDATKGDLDLTRAPTAPVDAAWQLSRMRQRLVSCEMPPRDADQPAAAERDRFAAALGERLRRDVPALPVEPGRVTVRRLSRTQWENVMRDLFGVRVATTSFPADDLGYGFDSIGDAMTFSTLHLENHLAAARVVAERVFPAPDPGPRRFAAETMQLVDGVDFGRDGGRANLYTRATIEQRTTLPRDGTYELVVVAGADQAGDEPAKMQLLLDGRELTTWAVAEKRPGPFALRASLPGGAHRFAIAFLNDFWDPDNADPARRDRNLQVEDLEIRGPLDVETPAPARAWLDAALAKPGNDEAKLRSVVRALLPRLWRRPVEGAESAHLLQLGREELAAGRSPVEALRLVLQAALVSPHCLFRIESGGLDGDAPGGLPGPALATRLAFFVWASTPDDRLRELGASGRLADPQVLRGELKRLLTDPRAEALATDFAAQWLELRSLADRTPDPERFPGFDDELRTSLRRETELVFAAIVREGRDVRDLLDCGFTFADARLAAFYGLPWSAGAEGFVRIDLPPALRERGGVLGHSSFLAVTSNPRRTSPVKRGKWILQNLLDQAPPQPPPGNDSLKNEAAVDSAKSFREQLAQHRDRKECAGCHVRMDALGFALERYDAIGRHRDADAAGPIDCSGELPSGQRLEGLADLKRVLRQDPAFVGAVARKLFVYAVGRDLRPSDRLRLDLRVDQLLANERVTIADLVTLVATDPAFLRRGGATK